MGGCVSAGEPTEGIAPQDRKNYGANPAFADLELFDLPRDIVYFNNPSYTLKHRGAVKKAKEALDQSMQVWTREPCKKQEIKELFAQIVNGNPEDVAMFPCTSHGISLLALNLGDELVEGDRIVMVKGQFLSNSIPWQELCRRERTKLVLVDKPDDLLTVDMERVKVVATFQCMWSDGAMTNLLEVKKRCEEVGAYLFVDATQSIGVMEFDVQKLRPHAVCASVHKWLGGVHGTSLMWLDPEFHKGLSPIDHNERNRKNPGDGLGDDGYNIELLENAGRLDGGGRPNPVLLPLLHASMQQILKWGIKNIEKHTATLTEHIALKAKEMRMTVPENHSPHIIGVSYSGKDGWDKTQRLQKYLKKRKIYTSFRLGAIRIGVWVYNTEEDVERFFAAVNDFENPFDEDEQKKLEPIRTKTL